MSNPNRLKPTQTKTTQRRDPNAPMTKVEKLAIMNRYVFPVVAVFGPVLLAWLLKWDLLIPLGVGCYIFGTYQLMGYKYRWDHIFCRDRDGCLSADRGQFFCLDVQCQCSGGRPEQDQ